jgi:hypothetical protein
MRVMQGLYIGLDSKPHIGTFGFVWLDLFEGQVDLNTQVHDFEPGIASTGLFWTVPVTPSAFDINLARGTATFSESAYPIPDFFDFLNAIGVSDNPRDPGHGIVSFKTTWRASGPLTRLQDANEPFTGFFRPCQAQIEWSALSLSQRFSFKSDAAATSTTVNTAVIGRERNGVFFPS